MSTDNSQSGTHLSLRIEAQPDDTTCGPTCLHAVYRYHGLGLPLARIIDSTHTLPDGGTLAVHLAQHALDQGFAARIHSWNLRLFDPSWFDQHGRATRDLSERLAAQARVKPQVAELCAAYQAFLGAGGQVRFGDLNAALVRRYLNRKQPVVTGLSATYLYRTPREVGETDTYDDLAGEPSGHFVVLGGYQPGTRQVRVYDPLAPNPMSADQEYDQPMERVIAAIMLGALTHDANLLVLAPNGTD